MVVVQPDELARSELAPALKLAEALLQGQLAAANFATGVQIPQLGFADIDYVAYVAARRTAREGSGRRNTSPSSG